MVVVVVVVVCPVCSLSTYCVKCEQHSAFFGDRDGAEREVGSLYWHTSVTELLSSHHHHSILLYCTHCRCSTVYTGPVLFPCYHQSQMGCFRTWTFVFTCLCVCLLCLDGCRKLWSVVRLWSWLCGWRWRVRSSWSSMATILSTTVISVTFDWGITVTVSFNLLFQILQQNESKIQVLEHLFSWVIQGLESVGWESVACRYKQTNVNQPTKTDCDI